VQGKRYNTGNTDADSSTAGQLLALMEGAPPVALDPRSLETLGEQQYGGLVASSFSAHPKIDLRARARCSTPALRSTG